MKRHQRQTRASTRIIAEENKVTKSSGFLNPRKRKSEDKQNDKSSSKGDSSKRRRIHFQRDDRSMGRQATASASELEKRVSKSKRKEPRFPAAETKRVTRLSYKKAENSKGKVERDLKSNSKQQMKELKAGKGGKVEKLRNQRKKPEISKSQIKDLPASSQQQTSVPRKPEQSQSGSRKEFKKSNSSTDTVNRKSYRKKKATLKSNTCQNTKNESRKFAKATKRSLTEGQKLAKNVKNSQVVKDYMSAPEAFSDLFLPKLDMKFNLRAGLQNIHGISVSNDNVICVNYMPNQVKLLSSSGEVLRCVELNSSPVLNCCLPSGDLLVTQGFAGGSKPIITSISREGDIKVLADLRSYASNLLGIICKDERIYVIGSRKSRRDHIVLRLNLTGEVEHVYNSKLSSEDINRLISLNGQIVGLRIKNSQMVAIEEDGISSVVLNKFFSSSMYAASASVDNLGNVVIGAGTKLIFMNPSLELKHEVNTDISGNITATAIDGHDQLWIGTVNGELFAAKYLNV
ncbi:uncharacterized protein LOC133174628 [Saccostrea echinata]|uniref:uncharacterized protein LOC133174628 n=1 Tax=Saccostrea echinata TaxID=191078 RepID=UPI002A8130A2|nr:uncharacterized protein LOC133174628 [Saccostrea echinata]